MCWGRNDEAENWATVRNWPSSLFNRAACVAFTPKMVPQYGHSIWPRVLLGSAVLFSVGTAAKAPVGNRIDDQPSTNSIAKILNANDTYFDNWHDQFVIDPLAPITTQLDSGLWPGGNFGNRPNKRQNCQGSGSTARNYCFTGNTATSAYCACQNRCCSNVAKSTGWCCAATVDCDVANVGCKWITYVHDKLLTLPTTNCIARPRLL
jgi:hypothetical protein